ncbi:MAG: hypothetical protein ACI8PT_004155 [Gammaproteobacteria bacterium]|jgi:hypothetical protein
MLVLTLVNEIARGIARAVCDVSRSIDGTGCAALFFSARDVPGTWYRLDLGHQALRARIRCEGCLLTHCLERRNECMRLIEVKEAVCAAESTIDNGLRPA